MGLIHPEDLEAFRADQWSRQSFARLRSVRSRFQSAAPEVSLQVVRGGPEPDVVIAIDSMNVSSRAAVMEPITYLDSTRVALVAPTYLSDLPIKGDTETVTSVNDVSSLLPGVRVGLSAGHHVPAGAMVHELITRLKGNSVVVQHGMLLPMAAPLPHDVHVAVWSKPDGEFWMSGRSDCSAHVVGSQLLFEASQLPAVEIALDDQPVYVGALHGTELDRLEIERIARHFCRATGAKYRPHPSETDVQSRVTHRLWKQLGIEFADAKVPLLDVHAPMVGMWSTGVLEAATAGRPAWVYHPEPPEWLKEVWSRYDLSEWGSALHEPPIRGSVAPAQRVGELLISLAG